MTDYVDITKQCEAGFLRYYQEQDDVVIIAKVMCLMDQAYYNHYFGPFTIQFPESMRDRLE